MNFTKKCRWCFLLLLIFSSNIFQNIFANENTITPKEFLGKNFVGYQAWFGTPKADGQWAHWANNSANTPLQDINITVEMWPDILEYPINAVEETPFYLSNGENAKLYSSANAGVIDLHFKWMNQYKIDGAFLQWFLADDNNADLLSKRNPKREQILNQVKISAEKYHRDFAVMFDISGSDNNLNCYPGKNKIENNYDLSLCLKSRWMDLVDRGITNSPHYLKVNNRPLIAIWGIGFIHNSFLDPIRTLEFLKWLTSDPKTPTKYRATLLGGIPTYWRTLEKDSLSDPAWKDVYRSINIISPWLSGRFTNSAEATNLIRNVVKNDIAFIKSRKQFYLPVIFPGFSWSNLALAREHQGIILENGIQNFIPRMAGSFIWTQAYELSKLGVQAVYTAMFDEVDEGTAIFKTVTTREHAPINFYSLTLDADNIILPSDFYLKVSQKISESLKLGKFSANLPMPIIDDIEYIGNQTLLVNKSLTVPAGRIIFQSDGNLVLYNSANIPLWASNTNGVSCNNNCRAVFQTDGNLVLYKNNYPFWATQKLSANSKIRFSYAPPYIKIISTSKQVIWNSAQSGIRIPLP